MVASSLELYEVTTPIPGGRFYTLVNFFVRFVPAAEHVTPKGREDCKEPSVTCGRVYRVWIVKLPSFLP